jgi:excisionase family DNA binding protein
MSQTINLELVRQGDAHLRRAKKLDPSVTARAVPVGEMGAFTVPQLASLAGVNPQTIRRAIAKGELKAAKSGHHSQARISRTDAEIWWRERGGGTLLGDLTPTPAQDAEATAGHLADFLKRAEVITQRMEAANLKGVNGAEVVRAGREEREQQIGE